MKNETPRYREQQKQKKQDEQDRLRRQDRKIIRYPAAEGDPIHSILAALFNLSSLCLCVSVVNLFYHF
jgi:hypothetical protein